MRKELKNQFNKHFTIKKEEKKETVIKDNKKIII
jgi:hypothetical protein